MKAVTLSWALKHIPDLTDREGDTREEHFRKREKNSLSNGMGARKFMACLGVMGTPWGLECGLF